MRKILRNIAILLTALVAFPAKAFCPVCVVAVGAGVGLSRWLGIDDLISGVWIGGLTVALIMWTIDWTNRKQIKFLFRKPIIILSYYVLILASLHFPGILWHPQNKFLGIDKIIFGIIAGTVVFLISAWLNGFLKNKNGGKVYFPYQKVVIPVSLLLVVSLVFYLILKL